MTQTLSITLINQRSKNVNVKT